MQDVCIYRCKEHFFGTKVYFLVFRSLIKLLQDCLKLLQDSAGTSLSSPKFLDLVMKVNVLLAKLQNCSLLAKLQNAGPLLTMDQTSRLLWLGSGKYFVLWSTAVPDEPNEPLNTWTPHLTQYKLFLVLRYTGEPDEPNGPVNIWTPHYTKTTYTSFFDPLPSQTSRLVWSMVKSGPAFCSSQLKGLFVIYVN